MSTTNPKFLDEVGLKAFNDHLYDSIIRRVRWMGTLPLNPTTRTDWSDLVTGNSTGCWIGHMYQLTGTDGDLVTIDGVDYKVGDMIVATNQVLDDGSGNLVDEDGAAAAVSVAKMSGSGSPIKWVSALTDITSPLDNPFYGIKTEKEVEATVTYEIVAEYNTSAFFTSTQEYYFNETGLSETWNSGIIIDVLNYTDADFDTKILSYANINTITPITPHTDSNIYGYKIAKKIDGVVDSYSYINGAGYVRSDYNSSTTTKTVHDSIEIYAYDDKATEFKKIYPQFAVIEVDTLPTTDIDSTVIYELKHVPAITYKTESFYYKYGSSSDYNWNREALYDNTTGNLIFRTDSITDDSQITPYFYKEDEIPGSPSDYPDSNILLKVMKYNDDTCVDTFYVSRLDYYPAYYTETEGTETGFYIYESERKIWHQIYQQNAVKVVTELPTADIRGDIFYAIDSYDVRVSYITDWYGGLKSDYNLDDGKQIITLASDGSQVATYEELANGTVDYTTYINTYSSSADERTLCHYNIRETKNGATTIKSTHCISRAGYEKLDTSSVTYTVPTQLYLYDKSVAEWREIYQQDAIIYVTDHTAVTSPVENKLYVEYKAIPTFTNVSFYTTDPSKSYDYVAGNQIVFDESSYNSYTDDELTDAIVATEALTLVSGTVSDSDFKDNQWNYIMRYYDNDAADYKYLTYESYIALLAETFQLYIYKDSWHQLNATKEEDALRLLKQAIGPLISIKGDYEEYLGDSEKIVTSEYLYNTLQDNVLKFINPNYSVHIEIVEGYETMTRYISNNISDTDSGWYLFIVKNNTADPNTKKEIVSFSSITVASSHNTYADTFEYWLPYKNNSNMYMATGKAISTLTAADNIHNILIPAWNRFFVISDSTGTLDPLTTDGTNLVIPSGYQEYEAFNETYFDKNVHAPTSLYVYYHVADEHIDHGSAYVGMLPGFLEEASVKTVTVADDPYTGAQVGDTYLDLFTGGDEDIYVPLARPITTTDITDVFTTKDFG